MDYIFNSLTTMNINFSDGNDLTESIFVGSPMTSISKSLNSFDFLPVNNAMLEKYKNMFKKSKILDENNISAEFISMLPHINKAKICYRMSKIGIGVDKFYQY